MRKTILFALMLASLSVSAQKIDFNLSGRQASQVTEDGFIAWALGTSTSENMKVATDTGDSITITIANDDTYAGKTLKSCWFKNGMSSSKLIADGFAVYGLDDSNNTPQITSGAVRVNVTISGLTAGEHSLLAYHNNTDGYNSPKLDVYVNGTKTVEGVAQTNRSVSTATSGSSYVKFTAEAGKDMVITYVTTPSSSDMTGTYYTTSLTVNAFIFDRPDPKTTASEPSPASLNYHLDADDGTVVLSFTAATTAVKHHIYLGTTANQLKEVSTQTANQYTLTNLTNLNTYYWRVDEEDASGTVYQGDTWIFRPRHLAFPGAEGYGKYATGGRGGVVYHVTNLEDNGDDTNPVAGSFRYGIKKVTGPRTIVFDVAGVIPLKSRLTCSDEYVTIAGQTAPGNGIMLRDCPFGMQSEGITRFLRMRLGHKELTNGVIDDSSKANGLDGMGMAGNDNSIMDHCSISWTIDEAFSSRNAKSLTLQRTLISEALNVAGHPNYSAGTAHGYAATIGGGEMSPTLKVGSYHHNLLVDCEGRNWSMSGGLDGTGAYDGHHDMFNNVCYNWGGRATDGGTHQGQFVNNYYKMGPATSQKYLLKADLEGTGSGTQSYYVKGNIRVNTNGTQTADALNTTYKYTTSNSQVVNWTVFQDTVFFQSLATIESAKAAYKNVLSDVGANQPFLDNHDTRMVSETLAGTTTTVGSRSGKKGLVDSEEDAGCEGFTGLNIYSAQRSADFDTNQNGMPDWWETVKNVSDGNADPDGDGYTNLEDYLNWMAVPHFTLSNNESVTINMKTYFAGYNNKPTFTLIPSDTNLTYTEGTNDGEYVITAKNTGKYLSDITVTATDVDNISTYTRTFHFYVTDGVTGINELTTKAATTYRVYHITGEKVADSAQVSQLPHGVYVIQQLNGKQVVSNTKAIIK
jgi:hypothetical protein